MTNYLQGAADGLFATLGASVAYVLIGNWWLAAFTAMILWMLALGYELLTYDEESSHVAI